MITCYKFERKKKNSKINSKKKKVSSWKMRRESKSSVSSSWELGVRMMKKRMKKLQNDDFPRDEEDEKVTHWCLKIYTPGWSVCGFWGKKLGCGSKKGNRKWKFFSILSPPDLLSHLYEYKMKYFWILFSFHFIFSTLSVH